MKAVLIAGGKATRLYPMTLYMPKQLIMINGYPVIRYIINHCKLNNISDFVLCISDNSLKNHFYHALGDGSNFGVNIDYSIAPESFGTAGRILHAKKLIKNNDFLIYYSDVLTTFNLNSFIDFHKKIKKDHNNLCTLAVTNKKNVDFGSALFETTSGKLLSFIEKPSISKISDYMVNCGIAICSPKVIDYCSPKVDFFKKILPKMISNGDYISCYNTSDSFYDVGSFSAIGNILNHLKKKNNFLNIENNIKKH